MGEIEAMSMAEFEKITGIKVDAGEYKVTIGYCGFLYTHPELKHHFESTIKFRVYEDEYSTHGNGD